MEKELEKLGTFPFVIGGASYIPAIGIIFGIIAIVWGLNTKKQGGKKLAIIGASGIGFSLILYGSLFYFGFIQRGGIYDDLRAEFSKNTLTSLVQAIEFYKVQNGNYPDSLETLQKTLPTKVMVSVYDPTSFRMFDMPRYFYYELKDPSHYYLLGVGPDNKPFTRDDILPDIEVKPNSNVGYIVDERSKNDL